MRPCHVSKRLIGASPTWSKPIFSDSSSKLTVLILSVLTSLDRARNTIMQINPGMVARYVNDSLRSIHGVQTEVNFCRPCSTIVNPGSQPSLLAGMRPSAFPPPPFHPSSSNSAPAVPSTFSLTTSRTLSSGVLSNPALTAGCSEAQLLEGSGISI